MQRILIIEDEDEIRYDIIDILKFKGFITEGASNGRIGLEAAKKFHPDLTNVSGKSRTLSVYKDE